MHGFIRFCGGPFHNRHLDVWRWTWWLAVEEPGARRLVTYRLVRFSTAGARWFEYVCERDPAKMGHGLEPTATLLFHLMERDEAPGAARHQP